MNKEQPFLTDVSELRARARKSIEKGAVTPAYQGDVKQTIDILQAVLATEIVCVLRYVNPTAYGDFHGARICAVPYVTPRSQERRSSATPLLNSEPFSTSYPALRMRVRPGLD